MKGTWVHDEAGQVWHLLWNRNHPDGSHYTGTTWCGKEVSLNWPEKSGDQISWNDTLHDECVRKSAEIEPNRAMYIDGVDPNRPLRD